MSALTSVTVPLHSSTSTLRIASPGAPSLISLRHFLSWCLFHEIQVFQHVTELISSLDGPFLCSTCLVGALRGLGSGGRRELNSTITLGIVYLFGSVLSFWGIDLNRLATSPSVVITRSFIICCGITWGGS